MSELLSIPISVRESRVSGGTRTTVYDVLSSVDEIIDDFPSLTREDILACLRYATEQ